MRSLIAVGVCWVLADVPWETCSAMLGMFAVADFLLVALPCCSPVMRLDAITNERTATGSHF